MEHWRVITDYEAMTMEFKVGKKRVGTTLAPKEMQPCEVNVMGKLCRGGARCFTIVIAGRNQCNEVGERDEVVHEANLH